MAAKPSVISAVIKLLVLIHKYEEVVLVEKSRSNGSLYYFVVVRKDNDVRA